MYRFHWDLLTMSLMQSNTGTVAVVEAKYTGTVTVVGECESFRSERDQRNLRNNERILVELRKPGEVFVF